MIPNDKLEHFLHGFIIAFTVGWYSPPLGFVAAASAGYGKERWDKRGHGTYDLKDFYWTCYGGFLGSVTQAALRPLFL